MATALRSGHGYGDDDDGCIGGAGVAGACCEPAGKPVKVEWRYAGQGKGAWDEAEVGYVHQAGGGWIQETKEVHGGCRPRACCWYFLAILCLVPLLLLGLWWLLTLIPAPRVMQETPVAPVTQIYQQQVIPSPVAAHDQISIARPVTGTTFYYACQAHEIRRYAPTLQQWCCATQHVCYVSTTAQVLVVEVVQRFVLSDCSEECVDDYGLLVQSWSQPKIEFCCKELDIGCPGKYYRCGTTTSTTPRLSFDCNAGKSTWEKGWGELKKKWCCENGSPFACKR